MYAAGIMKVDVSVISPSRRPRLLTLAEASIILHVSVSQPNPTFHSSQSFTLQPEDG